MVKGKLKINLDKQIEKLNNAIDTSIVENDSLDELTEDQRVVISNIVNCELLNVLSDFELNIFGGDNE